MSLVPPNNIRSLILNSIPASLVIIYILRNFYLGRKPQLATPYDPLLGRMEKLLNRVRSRRSLNKKKSEVTLKEEKQPKVPTDSEKPNQGDVPKESLAEISPVPNDDASAQRRPSIDQFSISQTPPKAYASVASLTQGPTFDPNGEPLEKNISRRSSLSKPEKKPLIQHVDFQEAKPSLTPGETTPPTSITRTSSNRRSKRQKAASLAPSLVSLFSHNTGGRSGDRTSTKSQRTIRRLRSTASVRRLAAYKAVDENFPTTKPAYIAIGSGSLMIQVVERISQLTYSQLADVTFVSTGVASEHIMASYKLRPITSLSLLSPETKIDVYFDTADEVDDGLNCIRGATGNLHLERMVAARSVCFICIIDYHKRVPTLFTMGKSMVVEVTPESYFHVMRCLRGGGAAVAPRRGEPGLLGLCVSARGNYLLDCTWPTLGDVAEDVVRLAEEVKRVYGVIDHGLFYAGGGVWNGRPNMVYVGLEDGAVDTLGESNNSNGK
ncbi:hypothetical protein TWF694_007625 [Orbilia ellipsospora]|uniref:Ribose-5-phosphate isomerase n=1 Tax=Orbilia ellipsospora TaxID=2528407 RepID=A0AAV9XIQ7_9PEZI